MAESKPKFIPFAERAEWKDIAPIQQDDGPNAVCKIAYTPQFSETMDYFRAILQKDERSERALHLTDEVIKLNAANYTAWYFRRLVIEAINYDLHKELAFITQVGTKNPKNYQIWYHRKAIVEKLKDFSQELEFTAQQIEEDSKNYHSWAHRQWVIETNGWWEQELAYTEQLLQEDLRNNSSWNQRHFVITRNRTVKLSDKEKEGEIQFTFQYIKKAPNNQSPWAYLKGLFVGDTYASYPPLKQLCLDFYAKYVTCSHVASLLLEIYEEERDFAKSIELSSVLETSLDSIHKKFWAYKKHNLEKKLNSQ